MTSFYRWHGAVERDVELQMVVKTTAAQLPRVKARLAELHSYELPEFLVLTVENGSDEYLKWVVDQTRPH